MYPLFIFCKTVNREIVLEIQVEGLWKSFGKVMEIFTVKSVRTLSIKYSQIQFLARENAIV